MKGHFVLMLVSIYLTSAIRPASTPQKDGSPATKKASSAGQGKSDMKYSSERERYIRFRNMPPVLAVQRNSQGQSVPFLPSGPRVLFRPNARYFIMPPRLGSGRNSRVKWSTSRLMTPTLNHGTSSLTAPNVGSSRNFQKNRFYGVSARGRPLLGTSFRSHLRIPTPRLSITRNGWSRRIILPQKPFPRETENKISKSSTDFPPDLTKANDSNSRSNVSEKEVSTTPTDSQSSPILNRPGFKSISQTRSGDTRALSAPQTIFFSPRSTSIRFRPRSSTSYRYINRYFGPRTFHGSRLPRPRMFPSSRTMFATSLVSPFQESRSIFRSINPDSSPMTSFNPFNRGISSGGWSAISPFYTLSKSQPSPDNSPWYRFGSASNPRSDTIHTMAHFINPFLARISKNNQSASKMNGTVDMSKYIAVDPTNGTAKTGNTNSSRSLFHITETEHVPNGEYQQNQTLVHLLLNGMQNINETHLGNTTQASISDNDLERPNAESPVHNMQGFDGAEWFPQQDSQSTGSQDVEKLSWLTEIANSRDGLEEALDDDDLISRLRQTGPHSYDSLMAALRKGSPFYGEIIADLKSEGQWEELLKAAGISPSDRGQQVGGTVQRGTKLDWLTELVNKKDELNEAIDEGELVTKLRNTGPHTYDELMAAFRKGLHFSDQLIADLKSEGEWRNILQAAGINTTRDIRENRASKIVNIANEIEVKSDRVASTGVQGNQAEHDSVPIGQQAMAFESAPVAVDQIPILLQPRFGQEKSFSDSSKGTTPSDSSAAVSQSKKRNLHTRSVPVNPVNANREGHEPKYWKN